jgi:hypothetical protein
MGRRVTVSALFALLLAAAPATRAGSIFSNFGAGSSYNTSVGNSIGNDFSGSNNAQGDTFTTSAAYTVTSLEIALSSFFSTNTDELQVSLTADSGDSPGAVLASFNVLPGTLGTLGANNAPVTFSAPPGITLTAGTQYWVTVADVRGLDSNFWNWNSTGDTSDQAISTDGGSTWFSPSGLTPGAYGVEGVAVVPEPSTLVLLSSGVVGLLCGQWRRLRHRTHRPPQTVPRPSRSRIASCSRPLPWCQT